MATIRCDSRRRWPLTKAFSSGISAGATLAGALMVAERARPGSNILCMLPDTGERYLSTPLFDGIPADMTSEEETIAKSTPNYPLRFPAASAACRERPQNRKSKHRPECAGVPRSSNHSRPGESGRIVCHWNGANSAGLCSKMFADYDIPYRSIDLDSVAYQADNKGGQIRKAIEEKTGLKTIPQIYIGGEHVGGATELFDAVQDGSMAELLERSQVTWDRSADTRPVFVPAGLAAYPLGFTRRRNTCRAFRRRRRACVHFRLRCACPKSAAGRRPAAGPAARWHARGHDPLH